MRLNEKIGRTVAKTLTYRLFSFLITLGIAYAATKDLRASSEFSFALHCVLTLWYLVHERLWLALPWGVYCEPTALKAECRRCHLLLKEGESCEDANGVARR